MLDLSSPCSLHFQEQAMPRSSTWVLSLSRTCYNQFINFLDLGKKGSLVQWAVYKEENHSSGEQIPLRKSSLHLLSHLALPHFPLERLTSFVLSVLTEVRQGL